MKSSENYSFSTIYKKTYSYIIDDGSTTPPTIIFRALSKKDISDLQSFPNHSNKHLYIYTILSKVIIGCFNINDTKGDTLTNIDLIIDTLSSKQKADLATLVQELSVMTTEKLNKLNLNIELTFDKKFATDTWDCEVCRYKNLDKLRNCKFRDDYEDLKIDSFKVKVGEVEYTDCPIYYRDVQMAADMSTCYSCYDKGFLPDTGSFMEQTDFFYYATSMVSRAINKQQSEAANSA